MDSRSCDFFIRVPSAPSSACICGGRVSSPLCVVCHLSNVIPISSANSSTYFRAASYSSGEERCSSSIGG